jgi:hypothetical protein
MDRRAFEAGLLPVEVKSSDLSFSTFIFDLTASIDAFIIYI